VIANKLYPLHQHQLEPFRVLSTRGRIVNMIVA